MHRIVYHWHQAPEKKYQDPEFYENGVICTVICGSKRVEIHRDGVAELTFDGGRFMISSPSEFRRGFPDGNLEVDNDIFVWENNAWFDIYYEGDSIGDVYHGLDEAVEEAEQYLKEWMREAKDGAAYLD